MSHPKHFFPAATAVFLLFCSFAARASAWAETGHKVIATIAFRQLDPATQQKMCAWLRAHPRYAEDFAAYMPPEVASADEATQNEWLFEQASIWPDMARGLTDDVKSLYNHTTWHYIDIPRFLTDADRTALEPTLDINQSLTAPAAPQGDMNAIQTIRFARRQLADAAVSDADKGLYLCWLLHVVGDIHQPLHSTAMFSKTLFPEGDKGGNSIPTQQGFSLHALWDTFPGDWCTFATARERTSETVGNTELVALGEKAANELDEQKWLDESRELCTSAVYAPEVLAYLRMQVAAPGRERLPPVRLSEEYLRAGLKVSAARVAQAGYRLGGVLKTLSGGQAETAAAK